METINRDSVFIVLATSYCQRFILANCAGQRLAPNFAHADQGQGKRETTSRSSTYSLQNGAKERSSQYLGCEWYRMCASP